MLGWFEKLVDPFPESEMGPPPTGFFAFLWFCSKGVRGYLALIMAITAALGVFEAALFSMLGGIVDWLGASKPADLFGREMGHLLMLAAVLAASPLAVAAQTWIKRQAVAGNFPMLDDRSG